MSKTLTEIAQQLSAPQVIKKTVTKQTKQIAPKEIEESKPVPKVQLIYAFNGIGKTRLSREFKQLVAPKSVDAEGEEQVELSRTKILYYNAFTEDLFYWDNDLELDAEPKLKIQPNTFTDWILKEQGDVNIIKNFQRYTDKNLTPKFILKEEVQKDKDGRNVKVITYPEVIFTASNTLPENTEESDIKIDENNLVNRGKDENIKISKGEESNFVWSIFYTLLQEVISILNERDPAKRADNQFDQLEYVFIDDPVSSLDENHLIELAVNLAVLIKSSDFTNGKGLKFIITTHSPLFYNVLHNELGLKKKGKNEGCYLLQRLDDGTFSLEQKDGDSNKSFSYHLHLKQTLEKAIAENQIQKYHFTLLRNLYEKTASFLGYREWADLLPQVKGKDNKKESNPYYRRIINFTSHSTLSNEEVSEPNPEEKKTVSFLLDHLIKNYGYLPNQEAEHG